MGFMIRPGFSCFGQGAGRALHLLAMLLVAACLSVALLRSAVAVTVSPDLDLSPEEIAWLDANRDSIRYGPNPDWPPGDYMEAGEHKGIVADYIKIFEAKLGIRFKRVYYSGWESFYHGLMTGEYDLVGACQKTEERERVLAFTQPFLRTRLVVLTRTNYPPLKSLNDLNSMTIAGIRGYSSIDYVQAKYPGMTLVECGDDLTTLLKVSAGAADGAVVDYMLASYLVDKYGITNLRYDTELDYHWDLRFAVNRSKSRLVPILDKVLGTISEQERRNIYNRWVGIRLEHVPGFIERNMTSILASFVVVLLLLVVVIFFNRSLQKQVDKRTRALRENERVLKRAKEVAETASWSKSQFLANMSHEIRTPLNGILGMLQLLETTTLEDAQKGYIQTAIRSSDRLTRLLTDILDLSRVEAKKLEIVRDVFDVQDTVEAITQLYEPSAREKGLDLRVQIHPGVPSRLCGDATRLMQILGNIVGNAIKFTNAGSVSLDVQQLSSALPDTPRVLFTVADTGIGIHEDSLGMLFIPFSQIDASYSRQFQGAGLGLAIARRLATLMDGEISVESEEGVGTTFCVSIPFGAVDGAAVVASKPEQPALSGDAGTPLRVLVVEDDAVNLLTATMLIRRMGHEVVSAENGQKALETLRGNPVDVVLMDVQMPVMDGVEATTRIRNGEAGEGNAHIPIVAMTAYAMAGDRERFLDAGLDEYIAKPVDMDRLHALLSTIEPRYGLANPV